MPKRNTFSAIIPLYNEQDWIAKSLKCLDVAVARSDFEAEIVVVDDGSSDESVARVKAFKPKSKRCKINLIELGSNKGRYLARKAGVKAAKHDNIMFIDPRVFIDKDALKYIGDKLVAEPNQVWNAHVNVAKKGNMFARFWDAVVCIAWRRYFKNPRETSYGIDEFDHFPKGTTCFFVPKKLYKAAIAHVDKQSIGDQRFSNDDTSLIRYIAERQRIHISPQFSCLYHGRSTLKKFLKHAYHRGQVFTDGFLRPGNRFYAPLLGFLGLTVAALLALLIAPVPVALALLACVALGMIGMFAGAVLLKVDWRDGLALAALGPFFLAVYGAGIWRGVFRKMTKQAWLKQRHFLGGSALEYLLVAVVFAVLTFWLTDWIVLHITHQMFVESSGDGTSGFLWLNYADRDLNPILGHTSLVNYPQGADLANPTYITYTALWVPLWVMARIFSPIVAMNLITFWGFIGCALAMYWLIKRLTRNMYVAFFAAFAVTFVPYHMVNATGHLAYLFSVVFILILAAFIGFWRRQTVWRAVILALTMALAYYTDGYFLLIASVFLGCLLFGGLVYDVFTYRKNMWPVLLRKVRYLVVMAGALIVLAIPIIYMQIAYGDKVNSDLAQARGDITSEMAYYAAWPIDYVLPALSQPYLASHYSGFNMLESYRNTRSNASENTLYVGWTVILIGVGGLACTLAYWLRVKRSTLGKLNEGQRTTFLMLATIVFVAAPILFLFSLKPTIPVHGHVLLMPAYILIKLGLTFWRVLARFFLPLDVLLVVFASLSLWLLFQTRRIRNRRRWTFGQAAIVLVLVLMLLFEFGNNFNKPPFDFHNFPPAYTWLKNQKGVKTVVEFPLIGKPWDPAVYDVTAQQVHDKNLINLHLPQQDIGRRNGLVSITNPEAVDYAADRGAQIAIVHDQPCTLDYPWLKLAYDGSKDKNYPIVCMYWLTPASSDHLFVNLKTGFTDIPLLQPKNIYYNLLYGNYAELWAMNQNDAFITKHQQAEVSMTLVGTPNAQLFTGTWRVLQNNHEISSGPITDSQPVYISAVVDASKPIQLRFNAADGSDPAVAQLSLVGIKLTAQ